MIFGKTLKWDTLNIQVAIGFHLEKLQWNVENSFGVEDSGESAFIITARKGKNVIVVYLENEEKQIRIRAGKDGKYLPEGKKIPKYSKTFPHTQIKQASQYFEKILKDFS